MTRKVAFVSGAGEGIGAAVARRFARDGIAVAVNDVDPAKARQLVDEIAASGGEAAAAPGDIADVAAVRGMIAGAVSAFGRLDIAVANAGITSWGDFFDYSPDTFDRVMGVNMRGTFFTAQAAARQMRDQGDGGRIVLTSSVAGIQAIRYLSAYSMTKAGIEMLAKNLVVELSPYGITINAIAPGATLTPRNFADDPKYDDHWNQVVPIGVMLSEDIAGAVSFLCSEDARKITGQMLVIDGGWTAISPTPNLDFVERKGE